MSRGKGETSILGALSASERQAEYEARMDRTRQAPSEKSGRVYVRSGRDLKCAVCGKELYAGPADLRRGRKYCSQACMGQAKIKTRECTVCGAAFSSSQPRKTCSPACASEAKRRSIIGRFGPQAKRRSIATRRALSEARSSDIENPRRTHCARPGCGAPLTGQAVIYCSPACHYADRTRKRESEWPIHRCQGCGTEFRWNLTGKGVYCSLPCARKHGSKRRRPPRVVTDAKSTEGFRRADFSDAANACRSCGSQCGLHNHHVVYRQHVEREKGDRWHPGNALCLCSECHLGVAHALKMPLAVLRDENYDFARALLGAGRAFAYLRRRYAGDDPRLDALAREHERAIEREYDHTKGMTG